MITTPLEASDVMESALFTIATFCTAVTSGEHVPTPAPTEDLADYRIRLANFAVEQVKTVLAAGATDAPNP